MDKIQKNLKEKKELVQYDEDELKYVQKPLGKAIYKAGRPKKSDDEKAKWNDKIKCSICNKEYIRSASNAHKITQYHKIHSKMNDKLKKLLIE